MPRVITVQKTPSSAYLSLAASIISLGLILFGAVGLLLIQKPLLEQSQDIRGNASVTDGKVLVTSAYSGTNTNGDHFLNLNANTQNLNVERFELVLHVATQTFTDAPRIVLLPNTNLQLTKTEIERTGDGFLLSIIAVPQQSGSSFTSNGEKGLIQLQFYPTRSGTVALSIDAEKSLAKTVGTGSNGDQLRPVATATYTITRSTASSSFKQCNESCTSNSQCAAGHRCYENRCRLATHPTNTSCDVPDDMGLQRQCNEYCADTRECASGFSCFNNRCRRPDNPDSTSCATTTTTIKQTQARSCNQACTSNAQCAVNMRCFQGACRLATNPSSSSCSAVTDRVVSDVYYPLVGGSSGTKGGSAAADRDDDTIPPSRPATGSTTTRPGATASPAPLGSTRPATPSGQASSTPVPPFVVSSTPVPSPLSSPIVTPLPEGLLGSRGITWPIMALAIGIGLLFLVIILTLVNVFRRRNSSSPAGQLAQKNQAYEADLQSRINSLRQQNGGQVPARPPVTQAAQTPPPSTLSQARPTQPIQQQATRPTLPVAPQRPAQPMTVSQPARPQPTAPQSVAPQRPTQPIQPTRPAQPIQPTRPTQPIQPARPSQPIQPGFSRPAAPLNMPGKPLATSQFNPAARPATPAPTANPTANPTPATRPTQPMTQPPGAQRPASPPPSSMMARLKQKGVSVPGDTTT